MDTSLGYADIYRWSEEPKAGWLWVHPNILDGVVNSPGIPIEFFSTFSAGPQGATGFCFRR